MAENFNLINNDDPASISSQYGCRPLPSLLDGIAYSDPSRIFASIPKTTRPQDGFSNIDYGSLAGAVSNCVCFLKHEVKLKHPFETIAYLGPTDLRYQIICFAALKAEAEVCFSCCPPEGNSYR